MQHLDGDGVVGASFDGCVVGNNCNQAAVDEAEASDDATGWNVLLAIEALARKLAELQKRGARVEQRGNTFARQHFVTCSVSCFCLGATSSEDGLHVLMQGAKHSMQ